MALTNNLVVSLKDFPALAESLQQRQPGDELELRVKVCVVENLTDRASFDIKEVNGSGSAAADVDYGDGDDTPLASSVMGVMAKKKK